MVFAAAILRYAFRHFLMRCQMLMLFSFRRRFSRQLVAIADFIAAAIFSRRHDYASTPPTPADELSRPLRQMPLSRSRFQMPLRQAVTPC
jgi:hypothetical protein